ncbi:hypothetical protein Tco_1014408 [Tanacetum coccineum]
MYMSNVAWYLEVRWAPFHDDGIPLEYRKDWATHEVLVICEFTPILEYVEILHLTFSYFGFLLIGIVGTSSSDSKNELSLSNFSAMNGIDGSGGAEGLAWIFSGLSFSSSTFSSGLLSRDSLCCLGWIMTALIEPWTWVEHYGSSVGAPAIRSVMAFNTVSILLVISLCSCLKSASNLVMSEQDELSSSVGLDFWSDVLEAS